MQIIKKKHFKTFLQNLKFYSKKVLFLKEYGWVGNFKDWHSAKNASRGYDSETILNKVLTQSLLAINKPECYERDGVLIPVEEKNWAQLAFLSLTLKLEEDKSIVDFGGSLGSTFFQFQQELSIFQDLHWYVIEQKAFVELGKKHFESSKLKFFEKIEDLPQNNFPSIILLSSVLQYLENPYEILQKIGSYNFKHIIIDRLPVFDLPTRITLQRVPPVIYDADYPCWIFNEEETLKVLEKEGYYLSQRFSAIDGKHKDIDFKGFYLTKK